ncbi:MAG: RepB family plasmid replication initiator protein [Candidatus Sedimenticola sp. (ex Thyasira tokunagai)]
MDNRKLIVTKSNDLIGAGFQLSLNEQRIILACLAQIDSRKPLVTRNIFTVSVKDFVSTFGTNEKSSYRKLEEAAEALFERTVTKIYGNSLAKIRWLYMVRYKKDEGMITLGFSPEIAPHLSELNKRFTSYNLSEIANLKSGYSLRLYEMLMQYKELGTLIISLKEFRGRFELQNKYSRFFNLKTNVIDIAVKEISDKTDYEVTCKTIKKGRTITDLHFTFINRVKISKNP